MDQHIEEPAKTGGMMEKLWSPWSLLAVIAVIILIIAYFWMSGGKKKKTVEKSAEDELDAVVEKIENAQQTN